MTESSTGKGLTQAEFAALYAEHGPRLLGYLRRQTAGAAEAEDLLQETFLRLLGAGFERRSPAETRRYLYRIAQRLLADRARAWKRDEGTASNFEPATEAPQADDGLDRAFRQLKPRDRTLLWLAYVEEFSHREIARTLGLVPGSVRVLLFRARRRLADRLKQLGLDPERPR